jgi:2-octaprenyl-3-methyl-6-methoxy-1,4-benzoquinol hydroxylase
MQSTDIIVIGGGMVGSLTAVALAECGFDVVLIERQWPEAYSGGEYDLRVSAISHATQRMFEAVGAWSGMQAMRVCPYARMRVWEADAQTEFDSDSIGRAQLGHIVENRVIQQALLARAQELLSVVCPASIESLNPGPDGVTVRLDNSETLTAKLVVAADGANSAVRDLAGIGVHGEAYDQHALVATVTTELPQQDITWQRFTADGPQAFLPLTGNRASLVWYQQGEFIASLKSLTDEAFIDALHQHFPAELGQINSIQGRGSFPLSWQHADSYVKPGIALVGDSAHSVHPLAGQGVNMGMLDAAALVDVIANAGRHDIGSLRVLRRYERWRKGSNEMMIRFLDGIQRSFQPDPTEAGVLATGAVKLARRFALGAAHHVGPLNKQCIKVAMGLSGDLPQMAHGRLPGVEKSGTNSGASSHPASAITS